MPPDTIRSAHFVHTDNFVQVTGKFDQTKINIKKGDSGGELDAHGADGKSNPIGAIVVGTGKDGNLIQFPEWTSFLGNDMVSRCDVLVSIRLTDVTFLYLVLPSSL
jgi:hypothetical protein